ncbi:MAG TPA: ABC transporter permease [Opitutaceae bacterium]|nr:ABC transporter permease [Opitutaceae bacterium]HOR24184.1 ABC transporter permease [Opitutaceae bacterium]HPK48450.1 ABC transporter permease [Opitutaceae bacterium]
MNLRRLWAIARKEALHIRRDPRSLGLAIGVPLLMLLAFGYALTLDVDRVPFVVWDQSGTAQSRELVARFTGTPYFSLQGTVEDYPQLEHAIDSREAMLALVIPSGFGRDLDAGRTVPMQAIVDGSDSNTAGIVLGYTQAIALSFNQQLALDQIRRRTGQAAGTGLDLRTRVWFNPDLASRNFIVPGILAVIMGLISALLTSLTIAREWETGTMEQLISTPVRAPELILGKLLPYLAIGLVDLAIAVSMTVFLFDVPLRGSVLLLFGVGTVFIVATLSQGILISTITRQQLLASQVAMIATFLPAFLLSGFAFAIANMPVVVRGITYIVPARYFVAIVKGIFLRGTGLTILWGDALCLLGFAGLMLALAIARTRKRLA